MFQSNSGVPFRRFLPVMLGTTLLLSACSSSKEVVDKDPVQARYNKAMADMEKRDYDNAILKLEGLMFSTRATPLEDKVLHNLASAYFQSRQYLLSAEIYRRLLQQTPDSPYAKDAQYQLARSFEKLSPQFELDQEYTVNAINEFKIYLDQYPAEDTQRVASDVETYRELLKLKPDNAQYKARYEQAMAELSEQSPARYANAAIATLREKLAHNRYSIASQYARLRKYRPAAMYYDQVIANYSDTVWNEPAWIGKIEMAEKRSKWFEARQALEQYLQHFPEKKGKVDATYRRVLRKFSTP
ncbi:MAG: outer membrane protein assembly factor BamD [Chlorobiaceae bacterium]|nr:outer membrane protein assembly factor BamD [Chlorobiaceae bacterium]